MMSGYAVAHIREVTMNADIVKYLEEIDATLRPFGGRFAIHGGDEFLRVFACDHTAGGRLCGLSDLAERPTRHKLERDDNTHECDIRSYHDPPLRMQ
jgi:hypothetical protein